jgi:hypothetical protein
MIDPDAIVSGAPPVAPPASDAAAAAAATAAETAALRKQIADLSATSEENARAAQFWADKARTGVKDAGVKEAAADADADVDLLELITTKGAKGLDDLMAKRGYVRGDDVDRRVNVKATEIAAETALRTEYPDLDNPESEFFKMTAREFGALKDRGLPAPDAMRSAAERTYLRFLREGKVKTPQQAAEGAKAQRDADRAARAAAGAGDRGGRAAQGADDDTLSDDDMAGVKFLAESLEIPMDEAQTRYLARAKGGVNVALKLDRSRK